jgi:predicted 3-demethylubiquinone-9 3-methyltransferase (glyoxalase superfamily)
MTVKFELEGQVFMVLNGGPAFTPNEAISFVVYCDTQEEIDYFWENLSFMPEAEQCGWLKDKFGISWQIVPAILDTMIGDKDPQKMERVTAAFLKMKKFSIEELKKAYKG